MGENKHMNHRLVRNVVMNEIYLLYSEATFAKTVSPHSSSYISSHRELKKYKGGSDTHWLVRETFHLGVPCRRVKRHSKWSTVPGYTTSLPSLLWAMGPRSFLNSMVGGLSTGTRIHTNSKRHSKKTRKASVRQQ